MAMVCLGLVHTSSFLRSLRYSGHGLLEFSGRGVTVDSD